MIYILQFWNGYLVRHNVFRGDGSFLQSSIFKLVQQATVDRI
jgi:hypothetical protein